MPDRKLVIYPGSGIDSIGCTADGGYELIDMNGRRFASFRLPPGPGGIEYTIHYSDVATPLDEIIGLADGYVINADDDSGWGKMKAVNSDAYSLLCKVIAMSGADSSPANDLTFADAVIRVVQDDKHYAGDVGAVLEDIDLMLDRLSEGTQADLNLYGSLTRLMTSLRLSLAYRDMVAGNELLRKEYVAWHNMMEAMVCYYEYTRLSESYSSAPMETELAKASWLRIRNSFITDERQILDGKKRYVCRTDSLLTVADVMESASSYHSKYSPEFYHQMWYEIAPAFRQWTEARNLIAESLPADRAASYRELSRVIQSRYAAIICRVLDVYWMRPALIRDEPDSTLQKSESL